MNAINSIERFQHSQMVSLREQSNSTLQAAIRSPFDPGETLARVNVVLALYFDPDFDAHTKAAVREEFIRALSGFPQWAVMRAFDAWVRTRHRRPSPAEIAILVESELKPFTDELRARDWRKREAQEAERDRQAKRVSPEDAARIMDAAGFTPKRIGDIRQSPMATTFSEAEQRAEAPHFPAWFDRVDPHGPEMAQLRAARDANPLVAAARRDQLARSRE